MTPEEVQRTLQEVGAVLSGHFRLTSGLHSDTYVQKALLLQYPHHTEALCRLIADHFRPQRVEVVAAPTVGGIILGYEVARQLGARAIFAEKDEAGGRSFQRGFRIPPGERTLVVDDVLTTGGSVREVVEAVRRAGGDLRGIGVLVDRSDGRVSFDAPFYACLTLAIPTYPPADCPLCRAGIPLTPTKPE